MDCFAPTMEDGTPRVFIGTHRPLFDPPRGYVRCSCGATLQTVDGVRDHWQLGHFDRPMYRDPEAA